MRMLIVSLLLMSTITHAETIQIPGPAGAMLNAKLFRAEGAAKGPSIVALHGCGGPFPSRDDDWGRRLASLGHTVVMPDSFGSRGLGSQCSVKMINRTVTATGVRRLDAIAVLRWLAVQPDTPSGGLILMGWSDGGSTTLAAGAKAPDLPQELIRGMVAFYPSCRDASRSAIWEPAAPLLILIGEADDWTPAAPCHALAERLPGRVTLVTYPGAYHDFDAPHSTLKIRTDTANTRSGTAHTGTDPAAREDAITRVPAFIAALPH